MLLISLRARGLRNLREVDLSLPMGVTVVTGRNGQGKSSLLEAAYLLGTGRSFRTRRIDELVAWKNGPLQVGGRVSSGRGETELAVGIGDEGRTLLVNGAKQGMDSFLGRLSVIDLTAERMAVLHGGPDERRRFLDRGVLGLDVSALRVFGEYRRNLQQRNALLRNGRHGRTVAEQLDAWDERLAIAARTMHLYRRRYAEDLDAELKTIGPELLPDGVAPRLHYRPSPPELADTEETRLYEAIAERLTRCRARDQELGYTSEGPHRDDLRVLLEGVDLRRFGSAGQARAAMITLKLGKVSLLSKKRGEAPLFLLDDFDTDLDDARMTALGGYLKRAGCQVLLATPKDDAPGRIGEVALTLRMDGGVARAA
jgi:DNA replication and repair protein RecF